MFLSWKVDRNRAHVILFCTCLICDNCLALRSPPWGLWQIVCLQTIWLSSYQVNIFQYVIMTCVTFFQGYLYRRWISQKESGSRSSGFHLSWHSVRFPNRIWFQWDSAYLSPPIVIQHPLATTLSNLSQPEYHSLIPAINHFTHA